MPRTLRTAVIAAAPERLRTEIVRALSTAGIELLAAAKDAHSAMNALMHMRADLLVTDAQLPGIEGTALALRLLRSFCLPVRPAVILMHDACFPLPAEDQLLDCGAVILEKPVEIASFCASVEKLKSDAYVFSDEELARTNELLNDLGVPDHRGRTCLQNAALLCAADERFLHNLGGELYPLLGKMCAMDGAQAERAMRHVIGAAWQSDKFENQYRIFADTVDAGRGQPTCGEMISRLADILRSEG